MPRSSAVVPSGPDRRDARIAASGTARSCRIDRSRAARARPSPVARQEAVDRRRLAREGDVAGRHLRASSRRRDRRGRSAVERVDERLADACASRRCSTWLMSRNSTKTPRARVLRHGARLGDRVRLAPHVLRPAAADDDVLELFDLLRRAVLEDLEVVLREIGDRRVVLRRDRRRRGRSWLRCGRSAAALRRRRLRERAAATARARARRGLKPLSPQPLEPFMSCPSRWPGQSTTGPSASSASIRSRTRAISASRSLIAIPAVSIGSPTRMLIVTGRMIAAAPLHRVAAARDRDRHDRRLRLDRHDEAALLERQHLAGPAARAFRERSGTSCRRGSTRRPPRSIASPLPCCGDRSARSRRCGTRAPGPESRRSRAL